MRRLNQRTHTSSHKISYFYAIIGILLLIWMIQKRSIMTNPTNATITNKDTNQVQYQLLEQGKLHGIDGGPSYMKYQVLRSISKGTKTISMKQWAETLTDEYESFNNVLSSCPFEAFFWECVPTMDGSNRMEFVLVDAPTLKQFARYQPDRTTFRQHFSSVEQFVSVFPSLGKDALLLAPNTQSLESFTDIAAFARDATPIQRKNLYQQLSKTILQTILLKHKQKQPMWLSTSGMGIAWMHIRLDSRPKYYTYTPYKSFVP